MKTITVTCSRCSAGVNPAKSGEGSTEWRELALNTMDAQWEVEGSQQAIADLCGDCIRALKAWLTELKR